MAAVIDWDVVEGWSVTKTRDYIEAIRSVCVRGIETTCVDGQNPYVLLTALTATGMPTIGTALAPEYPGLLLEDYKVRTINSDDSVMVDLIYRQRLDDGSGGSGAANTWTVTDSYQVSQVTTYATGSGASGVEVWYKGVTGGSIASGDIDPPAGAKVRVAGVHQFRSHRVITVSGRLLKSDWDTFKVNVRAAASKINSDTWGTSTRGTWLFLGPTTRFFDRNNGPSSIVYVELAFMHNPDGFYPLAAYIDPQGIHPADAATEAEVRTFGGLPAAGGIVRRNGKTLVSVQGETAFSSLFAFTPDT